MNVPCYWLEETGKLRRSFRRYCQDHDCSAQPPPEPGKVGGYCDDEAFLDEIDWPVKTVVDCFEMPHDDPRWPKACHLCHRPFRPDDQWQIFTDTIYRRTDTGALLTLREATPGAMWDAWWYPDQWKNPTDGRALMLRLPGGHDWCVDSKSANNSGWTRKGTPPLVSATPSILVYASDGKTTAYHGYLTDGQIVSC